MEDNDIQSEREQERDMSGGSPALNAREDWQEPKLTFIEPALTPHGSLTAVTGTFFGAFSPHTGE